MTLKACAALAVLALYTVAPTDALAQRAPIATIDGEIEVLISDHDNGSETHQFIKSNGVRRELKFDGKMPQHHTGDRVRVRGEVQPDGTLALASDGSGVQTLAASVSSTTGSQSVLVLLVNFQGDPSQPYSVADAETVMQQVSDHYWLGSYEQTTIDSRVTDWFTVAYDPASCDPSSIAARADEAAINAGIDLAAFPRRIYAFPQIAACNWWGLGTVGGNPSFAWINGTFAKKVVGHELGHNLGLYHANARDCGTTPLGPSCTDLEYGNPLDMMGNPSSGNFDLFAKEQIGWVNSGASPPLTLVTQSAVYAIPPYETIDAGSKGLKILRSINAAGAATYYYVEFRQPFGNDGFLLSNVNVTSGVLISLGSTGNSNVLLDMTPETASWSDPALVAGKRFVDPDTGLQVETLAVGAAGASVLVTIGGLPPSAAVSLNAAAPRTNDVLTATASTTDPGGAAVTLTYVWKVNGVTKKVTAATSSLSDYFDLGVTGQGDPGDSIVVEVTPFDGSLTGAVVSASATVAAQRKKK